VASVDSAKARMQSLKAQLDQTALTSDQTKAVLVRARDVLQKTVTFHVNGIVSYLAGALANTGPGIRFEWQLPETLSDIRWLPRKSKRRDGHRQREDGTEADVPIDAVPGKFSRAK